jgi:23S rRNA (adenine-N6)-dimethyltransferase
VDARSRARTGGSGSDGQHVLRSPLIAAELVREVNVGAADHVLEIGAGTGRLTEALADRADRVTAVELDPQLVARLHRAFAGRHGVDIVHGDILRLPLPGEPYRVFGNLPFGITTPILRRLLDDPRSPLQRADVILQFEAARKRAAVYPSSLLALGWLPWWEMRLARRIPRLSFEPPPRVDGGLLTIARRSSPLLDPSERGAFLELARRAFRRSSWPARRSLRRELPPRTWKRLARERGLDPDAAPSDLDVWDWVAVHLAIGRPVKTGPAE